MARRGRALVAWVDLFDTGATIRLSEPALAALGDGAEWVYPVPGDGDPLPVAWKRDVD